MIDERYSAPYKDKKLVQAIASRLNMFQERPMRFMEVCGTHTMSIFRHGIRSILPSNVELVSGPGCPVCVTSQADIDAMIGLAGQPGVIVATFGDLLRVPGTKGSLASAKARGARVEIVYSPADALKIACANPDHDVVFLGIGFETTVPAVAAALLEARSRSIRNFFVFSSHKTMPRALHALLADPELRIDGLLCPGHVSTIIGAKAYEPLAETKNVPCVIAGFEPADILQGIYMLAKQVYEGRHGVENCYSRAVTWHGNERAIKVMERAFEPCDAVWRGLGKIDSSGLAISPTLSMHDASKHFGMWSQTTVTPDPRGCLCGEVIKGKKRPPECPLFSRACTPTSPVGPCMVSSEGSCAAYFRYSTPCRQEIAEQQIP